MTRQRVTLLSTRQTWISLQVIILFLLEIVYVIIFWQYESTKDQATMEAVIATAKDVSICIVPTIVAIIGMFEIGGEIMIRFTSLMQKAIAEGVSQGIAEGKAEGKAEGIAEGKAAEGKAEGKAEVYRAWHADWVRRKQEAEAKGIPFDEPPPPKPEGYTEE